MSERKRHTRIYLDHAASTPLSPHAAREMERAKGLFGNPSSLHEEGRAARELLEEARERIARAQGASAGEVVLTASGSEGDALALFGVMHAYGKDRKGHLIVSKIEHAAILKAAALLEREGYEVTYLPVTREGSVTPEGLRKALRPDTLLVSVMYANNEIGTIEPIAELSRIVREARGAARTPLFHTDACQAPGLLPIDVRALGVDLMTLNGSKSYGPKGVGSLFVRDGVALAPVIPGEQWEGRRGGTESVALALGFAAALEEAEEMRGGEVIRLKELQALFLGELRAVVPQALVNGSRGSRLPNNVHVTIPQIEGESILLMLDLAGIACSTGSACNSLDLEPSHVLLAAGQDPDLAHGSIRFSMGRSTRKSDVLRAVAELARIVRALRSVSSLTIAWQGARV